MCGYVREAAIKTDRQTDRKNEGRMGEKKQKEGGTERTKEGMSKLRVHVFKTGQRVLKALAYQ